MARRLTYLILTVAGIVVLFFVWSAWRNSRTLSDAEMLKRLPTADSIVLSIDFDQLRHSPVFLELAGSKVVEEPDYQAFVRDSGFDYKRDLERALISFTPSGTYFVIRGHFDWQRLHAYASHSGGSCYNDLCHMPGTLPERRISFLPLAPDVMGMAVSTEDLAASQLLHTAPQRAINAPTQPVWISTPGTALQRSARSVSFGSLLAPGLSAVNEAMLTIGPSGDNLAAHLEAECRTPQDAVMLNGQLNTITSVLKRAMEREKKQPAPGDLTGLLTEGQFHQSDRTVIADWVIHKSFIDNLAGM